MIVHFGHHIKLFKDVSFSNDLSPEQISEAESLIEQYPDVLTSLTERTAVIRHNIKLLTTEPVRSKGYLIPYKTAEVVQTEIHEMPYVDIIEPSVSPYSLSVVLILKKDCSLRFSETEQSYRILCRINAKY